MAHLGWIFAMSMSNELYNVDCFYFSLSNMPITKIHARQIFDSRGNPTVEVDLTTEKGKYLQKHKMFCSVVQKSSLSEIRYILQKLQVFPLIIFPLLLQIYSIFKLVDQIDLHKLCLFYICFGCRQECSGLLFLVGRLLVSMKLLSSETRTPRLTMAKVSVLFAFIFITSPRLWAVLILVLSVSVLCNGYR